MSDVAFAELTKTVVALPYEEKIALIDALKKSVDENKASYEVASDCDVMEISNQLINQNLEAYKELFARKMF